jgi:hypothetical protein
LISLTALGVPEQEDLSMTYWPPDLENALCFYTVTASDQPANRICELTIHWKDDNEIGTLTVPSGAELIETIGELEEELDDQLADLTWKDDMNTVQFNTFHEVLWHKYREATVKKVTMLVPVFRSTLESSGSEKEILRVALPSGYHRTPRTMARGFVLWLAKKGYKLAYTVEDFQNAYYVAADEQREMYGRRNPWTADGPG